jgi:hypothetical protein
MHHAQVAGDQRVRGCWQRQAGQRDARQQQRQQQPENASLRPGWAAA